MNIQSYDYLVTYEITMFDGSLFKRTIMVGMPSKIDSPSNYNLFIETLNSIISQQHVSTVDDKHPRILLLQLLGVSND